MTSTDATFPVQEYLRHCGERFAATWTAHRFLALSLSADLHRVNPGDIRVPSVLVAAEGDQIIPREQMEYLALHLGARNRLLHLPTLFGHDAFLTEPTKVARILQSALDPRSFA
jgi:homoserine O-acetyltransferase